jgi:hypothetical protein
VLCLDFVCAAWLLAVRHLMHRRQLLASLVRMLGDMGLYSSTYLASRPVATAATIVGVQASLPGHARL